MSIRALLHEKPAVTVAICGVLILVGGLVIGWRIWSAARAPVSPPRMSMAYFYDLNTGELFEADASLEGPIETDSGPHQGHPAGVRANVFSCTSCNDESARFIGYLEIPADALEGQSNGDDVPVGEEGQGLLIRREKDDRWVPFDGRQGDRILQEVQDRCGEGKPVRYCHPRTRLVH